MIASVPSQSKDKREVDRTSRRDWLDESSFMVRSYDWDDAGFPRTKGLVIFLMQVMIVTVPFEEVKWHNS